MFGAWLEANWFTLVQSVGIVGSLWFAVAAFRREVASRKVGDLLTLSQHHRDLWSEVHRRPELGRVLQREVDFLASPISLAEEEFLNVVIVHFQTSWLLASEGAMLTLDVLAADVRWFFSLPLPRAVWQQTREFRDPVFVEFVENAIALNRAGAK